MRACCVDLWSAQLLNVPMLYRMDLQLSGVLPSTLNDTLSAKNKKKLHDLPQKEIFHGFIAKKKSCFFYNLHNLPQQKITHIYRKKYTL